MSVTVRRVGRRRSIAALAVVAGLALGGVACSSDEPTSFCTFYRDFESARAAAEAAPGDEEANPDVDAILDDATRVVPDEIEASWAVIVDSQHDFARAREEAGLTADEPDEEAFEEFDMSDELAAAEDDVSGWVDQNCEPVNDL